MRNKSSSENAPVKSLHPGQHIRDTVLTPKGMSVTARRESLSLAAIGLAYLAVLLMPDNYRSADPPSDWEI